MQPAGKNLRTLREKLGLTMRDVENSSARIAEKYRNEEFSIPPSRLSDIETKAILPSIMWALRLREELPYGHHPPAG